MLSRIIETCPLRTNTSKTRPRNTIASNNIKGVINIKTPQYVRFTKTATADTPFKVVNKDTWVYWADAFILTNSAYKGDIADQDIPILTNDVYTWLTPINLNEVLFKNYTAGSNTKIILTGLLMSDKDLETLFTKGYYGLKG